MNGSILCLLAAVLGTLITMSGEEDTVDSAPRIITNNGNLVFQSGTSKAIHFETLGSGDIKFNEIDVREFYGQIKEIKTFVNQNRNNNNNNNNQCNCTEMKVIIETYQQKLKRLGRKLKATTNLMTTLQALVHDLNRNLTVDKCVNNPCHNGGTCINGFLKPKCICNERFQGEYCTVDVNECIQLAGTDLGCQNNARCENRFGDFRCICTGKWVGVLCNTPKHGCIGSSNVELCGHGTCITDNSNNNERSFSCICDHGWSLDQLTKTCIIDVNECEVGRYPCSQTPLVPCLNTPGGFTCGRCPPGYQGNGFSCFDINECLNGDICGINQICKNSVGSYQCLCAEGMSFNQNGVCQRQNICQFDNGGCNINAQCTPNTFNIEGRICVCNGGYEGTGVGSNGCVVRTSTNTTNYEYQRCVRRQLCKNGGTCQATETAFVCRCANSFTGRRCRTQIINRCLANPCLNGGTCTFQEPNNYQCTCPAYFSGLNCETEHTECGGSMISPRNARNITFLISSQSYRYPCVWTVLVPDEQYIEVKPFALHWLGSCSQEYVQILEKSSTETEYRELGKYCIDNGQILHSGYNTSGTILMIKAHFLNNVPGTHGFILRITPRNFVTQIGDCCRCLNGGHVVTGESSGIFQSPHYPLAYPQGTDCIMQYERAFGQRYKVAIFIKSMDLGDSNGNCSDTDFIKIFYAERGESKITACNQVIFQNQRFITSGFKIQFHSNLVQALNPSRFQIFWRKTVNEDPCGDTISFQNRGSIEVPQLPENQEVYCTWNIHQSNESQMIDLKGFFNNWRQGDCSVYIKIINVDLSGTSILLWEQCQNPVMLDDLHNDIVGQLIIIFKKSMGVSTPSFRIQATYVCGKIIDMDQLTQYELKSPNYPENYDNNLNCIYKFVARTRKFSVRFDDFDVVDESYPCNTDYITIQGGTRLPSSVKYCNANKDFLISVDKEPSSTNLVINFTTNSSVTGRGFKAVATLLDCGGSYLLTSRLVITYPDDHINNTNSDIRYQSHRNCEWNIITLPGYYMLGIFDHFHLEYHADCRYDWLSVSYDNITDARYCGNHIENIVTRSNKLKIVFKSDYSVSGEGFIARFYVGSTETHCHQELIASQGRITSPPVGTIQRPYLCLYTITVPPGRKVVINITMDGATNEINNPNKCFAKAKLRIKNGNVGATVVKDICPESPQREPILTSYNKATILYLVPAYFTAYEMNFTISFTSIDEECGSIHDDDSGEIASANYPLYAPANTYCQWEIRSSPGKQISIRILHIRAGYTSNTRDCNDNKRPVIKLVSLSQEISISCESHGETIYNFEDEIVRVIFQNYENTQYRFRLRYTKACIITTNSSNGRIESNNLITNYPNYCSWTINIMRGNTLYLQFDQFDLPNPVDGICKTFVTITDSKNTLLGTSCGNTLINNTFQTMNSPVTIIHNVQRNVPFNILQAHTGFILEYNTHGCVFNINYDPNETSYFQRIQTQRGSISSPRYPETVTNTDCIWIFKSANGYSVKLKFDVIELDSFVNCTEGYILKARESENPNEQNVFQSCSRITTNEHPIVFQSSTNYVQLTFLSANDQNGGQRKFHATYEFINTSCEYQLTATEGIIKSPNYPGLYPTNINCRWDLSVRQGMSIHLYFQDFEIEGSSCRYDYVQLFSQLNAEMMPMTRLCGNNVNSSQLFESISNEMLVTLKTDSSVQKRGFKARFFEGCGGQRNATEVSQWLLSPNYPHLYSLPDSVCEWTITANASSPDERIFFYFLGFEGDSSDVIRNCSITDNSLTIVDGLSDTPIKVILCANHVTPPIISSGHYLKVILKSTNGRTIFKAKYGTGSSTCGGEYFLDDGIFTSPFYPNAVNLEMDCKYIIRCSPGSEIDLTIEEFERTNPNAYDLHDFLEIRLGEGVDSILVDRFYNLRDIQNATNNVRFNSTIVLRFRSQGGLYTNTVKFLARYHINYPTDFPNDHGTLASPQFGHLYKYDTIRTWTISPLITQSIDIQFSNFSVGRQLQSGDCTRGKLMISDAYGNTKSLCGQNIPQRESYAVPVSIVLTAEGYRYGGFLLNWSISVNESFTRTGDCKYVIQATRLPQILTSPNFPNFDPINRDCEWTIVGPKDGAIDLQILNFTLENSRNCKYESFSVSLKEVRYNPTNRRYRLENNEKKFCGTQNSSLLNYTKNMIFSKVVIRFNVDQVDIFPGFQLQYKLRCFKEINSIEGWLQNSEFPNYMTEFKNCTYFLRLRSYRNYQLNITSLNLPPKTNGECQNGYLEINTMQRKTRYCGSNVPNSLQPLLTNSSQVLITIAGSFDTHSTYSGFQLRYSLDDVEECGGNHILSRDFDSITIANPRNNSMSPHYIECKWYITSPYGTRMKIDFMELRIYSASQCQDSFISLFDGSTVFSKKIGNKNYCFYENSVFTLGNKLFILFKNLNDYAKFQIRISLGICGGKLYRQQGTIQSPNFPLYYPKQTECLWTIIAYRRHSVVINFDDYFLDNDCIKANLTISSVGFNWSNCDNVPTTIHVLRNIIQISFITNGQTSARGFKLSYQARKIECGGTLSDPSGEARSVNYPQSMSLYTPCVWSIQADVSRRVTIIIKILTLGNGCLRMTDEQNIAFRVICRQQLENYEIDTGKSIININLVGDGNSRIYFTYHTDLPSLCGSHIYPGTNETGLLTIVSSSNISYCRHVVHNYPDDTGTVVFKVIKITGLNCAVDRIKFLSTVYAGVGTDSIVDYLQYCNIVQRNINIFTTMGKMVDVIYDARSYLTGENALVSLSYKYQRCGGILTDSYGYIASPNYPHKYPHHSNCEWIIKAPENFHIKLVVLSLHLEHHNFCGYDYLKIRSGPEFDSPPIKTFCGRHNITNETIIFRHDRLRLSFQSDLSAAEDGFLIQYDFINAADNCIGLVFNVTGSIHSPNYPNPYPSNINCNWTIILPQGYQIELTVQQPFNLETGGRTMCSYDAVEIIDSNPSKTIVRLCGHIAPTVPILSSENRVGIQFSSDYNLNLDGFNITYKSVCGGIFNNTYGQFSSPDTFIRASSNVRQCTFTIPAWKNYLTVLKINPLLNHCSYPYGYIEIWKEIIPGRYVFSQNICGRSNEIVIFNSRSIRIIYNATFYGVKKYKFKAVYLHDETIKVFNNFTKRRVITTPQFPTPYHHNADLQWKFQAPPNYIFHIEVQDVDIEYSSNGCLYDYVAFYNSSHINSSNIVAMLCGRRKYEIPFKIESNNMVVHFVSDSSHYANHTGFRAVVISSPGPLLGCGGTIILEANSRGSISSVDLNNDGNYENQLLCEWKLFAPMGYTINLRFENNSVALERRSRLQCRYDWLKIYDGPHQISELIRNLCGNDSVDPITSSGTRLLIIFQTDSSFTDRGFKIFYSVILSLNNEYLNATSNYQTLTSPQYPDSTSFNFKSTVEIFTPTISDHILIEIKQLSIRSTVNCSLDSFLIRDVSLRYANKVRKFCRPIQWPVTFISSDTNIMVMFKVGPQEELDNPPVLRYRLDYKIYNCNRTEQAYSGRIVNIENQKQTAYSHNTMCNLTLEAPSSDLTYQFYFKRLILENSVTCAYDYIQFTFGRQGEQQYTLPKICGSELPPSFTSNSSHVTMLFVTDSTVALDGFDITYVVNRDSQKKCGGDIELDSGVITSPGFGTNVYEIGQCVWNIAAMSDKVLTWKITDLQLGSNITMGPICTSITDYIQITDGSVVRKFCGYILPSQHFEMRTDQIIVEYKSIAGGTGIGFRLEWNFVAISTSYNVIPSI